MLAMRRRWTKWQQKTSTCRWRRPTGEKQTPPDLVILNASELVSARSAPVRGPVQGDLVRITRGGLAISAGLISAVGQNAEIDALAGPETRVIDAAGRSVVPAFIDPHTHALFAGERREEFDRRLRGESYGDILRAGGGILSTVGTTRAASADQLAGDLRRRLSRMVAQGTTIAEVKTGYGLNLEQELKLVDVLEDVGTSFPIVPTFLAAHAVPPEFSDRSDDYVDLVREEMLPAVAGRVRFCDVFCEAGAFSLGQSRQILASAAALGIEGKLHADQLTAGGGAELAVEVGARSADHLGSVSEDGVRALGASNTTAVLLPASSLYVRGAALAPARALIATGAVVAIGSDCNPGSSPVDGMPLVISLACLFYGLTPAESLSAATANAAYACGLESTHGLLAKGYAADIVILDSDDYRDLAYRLGARLVQTVLVGGEVVASPLADGAL